MTTSPLPSSSPSPSRAAHAHSFNAAAAQYAANRPSYPPALLDTVERAAARPLDGARVADVGAGTGMATALLRARGADVIAVEPGEGMAAQFRRLLPDTPVVRGDGDSLPLATASVDLVTYAQSWHWTDPARSLPEAMRVLRPAGALALWWNNPALDVPWQADQNRRVEEFIGGDAAEKRGSGRRVRTEDVFAGAPALPRCTRHEIRWSRTVPLDTHLANIGSYSVFLVRGEEATAAFFAEERAHLLRTFPGGRVEETYQVVLLVVPRP
ncbi:class I SAM-dependent methyltransferase [Streptomyces beigongshangae]|uniref:class I SAM-dependent methyltransferase n=1 Tax=Streptomyces beigongshangae TaxID=2841597 RepID=UPI001C85FB70|nr:class I SAM-dependent methyltransferase [Streptomyces sp. REN17]